jgi:hypothetical protein
VLATTLTTQSLELLLVLAVTTLREPQLLAEEDLRLTLLMTLTGPRHLHMLMMMNITQTLTVTQKKTIKIRVQQKTAIPLLQKKTILRWTKLWTILVMTILSLNAQAAQAVPRSPEPQTPPMLKDRPLSPFHHHHPS